MREIETLILRGSFFTCSSSSWKRRSRKEIQTVGMISTEKDTESERDEERKRCSSLENSLSRRSDIAAAEKKERAGIAVLASGGSRRRNESPRKHDGELSLSSEYQVSPILTPLLSLLLCPFLDYLPHPVLRIYSFLPSAGAVGPLSHDVEAPQARQARLHLRERRSMREMCHRSGGGARNYEGDCEEREEAREDETAHGGASEERNREGERDVLWWINTQVL